MRLCLFDDARLGLVQGDLIHDVTEALDGLAPARYPLPRHDLLIAELPAVRQRVESLAANAASIPVAQVRLSSPVANPGKIDLELIEVQVGSYTGEDDIVRFEDVYGR